MPHLTTVPSLADQPAHQSHLATGDRPATLATGMAALDFEHIYQTHADAIFAFIVRLVGHHADAEDCFQAAWLAIHRGLDSYQEQGYLLAWLYKIARNAATDELRRRQRRPPAVSTFEAASSVGPADHLAGDELGTALATEIASFSSKVRTAYHLRIEQGLPFADIATILDEPVDRLAGRVRVALKRLRAVVEHHQGDASC